MICYLGGIDHHRNCFNHGKCVYLENEGLHHGPVDLELLGLDSEHLVKLEGLCLMVGERFLLDRDLPRVGAVHNAVAAGILLSVEGATPGLSSIASTSDRPTNLQRYILDQLKVGALIRG